MNRIKEMWGNKWVKFGVVSVIYILLFVVWTGNPWMLFGLLIIYDVYISKYMYRLVWRRHKELKKRNDTYRVVMDWVEAIVFAVVVATFIRFFVFGMYVIPTPSMEKTLLVGDYLWVNKLAYGPTVPNTPVSFPLVHNTMPLSQFRKSYVEWIKWPYHRLKGFGHVKRGDAVVFNFPEGDTVITDRNQGSYYDILRYQQAELGETEGRKFMETYFKVQTHPVDKRENYVKRCVGIPGDTIRIINTVLYVNGEEFPAEPGMQTNYSIQTNGTTINPSFMSGLGIARRDMRYDKSTSSYEMPLTEAMKAKMEGLSNVVSVAPAEPVPMLPLIFPHDAERYAWTENDFGPLWVPKKGTTVSLTADNLPFFRRLITAYEGHSLDIKDGVIHIDGEAAGEYTFAMDYYFMMGDNRQNSADSRFWGFVPEDHIIGRASFVWLSIDEDKTFPANIRWSRMLRGIE